MFQLEALPVNDDAGNSRPTDSLVEMLTIIKRPEWALFVNISANLKNVVKHDFGFAGYNSSRQCSVPRNKGSLYAFCQDRMSMIIFTSDKVLYNPNGYSVSFGTDTITITLALNTAFVLEVKS